VYDDYTVSLITLAVSLNYPSTIQIESAPTEQDYLVTDMDDLNLITLILSTYDRLADS